MATNDRPSPPRIRLELPGDWTPLPAWYPELAQAWQDAMAAGRIKWPVAGQFLQALWQTEGRRVQLRGRWDWVQAEFMTLDWPLPERGPMACCIDVRSGRIIVYNPVTGRTDNGARVVHDVQIRLQPDETATALVAAPGSAGARTSAPSPARAAEQATDVADRPPGKSYEPLDRAIAQGILKEQRIALLLPAEEAVVLRTRCPDLAREWLRVPGNPEKMMAGRKDTQFDTKHRRLRNALRAEIETRIRH